MKFDIITSKAVPFLCSYYEFSKQHPGSNRVVKEKIKLHFPQTAQSLSKWNFSTNFKNLFITSLAGFFAGATDLTPKKAAIKKANTLPTTYDKLPRSAEDEKNVSEIISLMDSYHWSILGTWYKSKFENLGSAIEHVHPLRLLGFVFGKKSDLKTPMENIVNDEYKIWGFLYGKGKEKGVEEGGVAQKLEHHAKTNQLKPYIDGFAKEVQADPKIIEKYVETSNWEGLVNHLSSKKSDDQ